MQANKSKQRLSFEPMLLCMGHGLFAHMFLCVGHGTKHCVSDKDKEGKFPTSACLQSGQVGDISEPGPQKEIAKYTTAGLGGHL